MDPDIKAMFQVLIEGQILTDKNLRSLTEVVDNLAITVDKLVVTVDKLVVTVDKLVVTVDGFVTSSEARFKRLEDNLDGLIRAITKEHSNGKH